MAPFPETLDAIQVAVRDTRARTGLDPGTTSLSLDPDALGRRDIYSPILHLRLDAEGAVQVAAVTTGDDILRALQEVKLRGPDALASRPDESVHTLDTVAAVLPSREELLAQPRRDDPIEPRRAALLADDPKHPDFDTFNRIHQWVRGTGQWDDDKSRNIAAALYREQANDPLMKRVDTVGGGLGRDGSQNVFAVYAPYGEKGPFFHAKVDGREAAEQPALQNLLQAEQLKQSQDQALQQEREQSQMQDRKNQNSVALSM